MERQSLDIPTVTPQPASKTGWGNYMYMYAYLPRSVLRRLKLVSFLGGTCNQTKSASVCPWLLRGAIQILKYNTIHIWTFGKFFAPSCLWRFGVKLRHSIRTVYNTPFWKPLLERTQNN